MKAAGLHGAAGRSRSSEGLAGRQAMRATGMALHAPDEAPEALEAPEPALHGAEGSGWDAPPPLLAMLVRRCVVALAPVPGAASSTLPASAAKAFAAFGPTNPGVVQTGALVVCVAPL